MELMEFVDGDKFFVKLASNKPSKLKKKKIQFFQAFVPNIHYQVEFAGAQVLQEALCSVGGRWKEGSSWFLTCLLD